MIKSSYKYNKLTCILNSNNSKDDNNIKIQSYNKLLSEFKNILEFKSIYIKNNENEYNQIQIDTNIINSILFEKEKEKEDNNNNIKKSLLNNEFIKTNINYYKNIILKQIQEESNIKEIYFTEIQLFLIKNSINSNWYFQNNNNNNLKGIINNDNSDNMVLITILVTLNKESNEFNSFINYQIGSIDYNNNNNDNDNDNEEIDLFYSFIPNISNNKKSFKQLKPYLYISNNSLYKSCLEMIEFIRNHSYEGTFEIHISVDEKEGGEEGQEQIKRFKEFCLNKKLKSILIELSSGKYSNQMMTSSHHSGNLKTTQLKAYEIASDLLFNQFNVSRLKIEILSSCKGVPITNEQHYQLSPLNYFEFHIKLLLPMVVQHQHQNQHQQFILLNQLLIKHNAHLSKNSFKINLNENNMERFLTLRMYAIGRDNAILKFENCKSDLQLNNFNILSSHREYSIYDTNINLDKGWIEI